MSSISLWLQPADEEHRVTVLTPNAKTNKNGENLKQKGYMLTTNEEKNTIYNHERNQINILHLLKELNAEYKKYKRHFYPK